jgi:hypothetical protein
MNRRVVRAAVLGLALVAQPLTDASAAVYAEQTIAGGQRSQVERAQFGPPGWRGGWRPGMAWRGPHGWRGRPYWFARPWVARPYYGTIIAGVALGTLITVAAVGSVPPRPAPNLCWYWADPSGGRGYWDYCS